MQSSAVKKLLCQSLAVIALASGEDARAADSAAVWDTKAPAKAPVLAKAPAGRRMRVDWTGFYVGAHAGK